MYIYNLRSLKMSHASEDSFPPKLLEGFPRGQHCGHSGDGDDDADDDDDVYYYYHTIVLLLSYYGTIVIVIILL